MVVKRPTFCRKGLKDSGKTTRKSEIYNENLAKNELWHKPRCLRQVVVES